MGCGGSSESQETVSTKDGGTLMYFAGLRSRGEPCRMIAALGNVALADELITFEQWATIKGEKIPTLPVIKTKEGETEKIMGETEDICKHLAQLGGELVINDKQAKLIHIANSNPMMWADVHLNIAEPASFGAPPLAQWIDDVVPVLKEVAGMFGDGPFFAGAKPGYGEVFIWHNIDNQTRVAGAALREKLGADWAKLQAFHKTFAELPPIKQYLMGRPNHGQPGSLAQQGAGISCCHASPDSYKDITPREHENGPDYLKGCTLVHMTLKKGEKDTPHDHSVHYMYIIKGGKVKIVGAPAPPGETMEAELPTGAGMIMPAGPHQVENVGDADVELLFIEVGQQVGETPKDHIPPQETDECHYKTLAEDEDWMVVKMDIKAGEADHAHSHREHVVYVLSEGELSIWGDKESKGKEMSSDGAADLVIPVKPGMVLPVPIGFHVVKNTGSTDVSAVYFERKR